MTYEEVIKIIEKRTKIAWDDYLLVKRKGTDMVAKNTLRGKWLALNDLLYEIRKENGEE